MRNLIETVERLIELQVPDSVDEIQAILKRGGWEPVGEGTMARVFGNDAKDYVLKVYSSSDTAYREFATLASQNRSNPHFPRFVGKPMRITPNYNSARMERLEPFKGDYAPIRNYVYYETHKVNWSDEGSTYHHQYVDAKRFFADKPELVAALDLIVEKLTDRYDIDISPQNLMMRGSTIVIIDPVYIK